MTKLVYQVDLVLIEVTEIISAMTMASAKCKSHLITEASLLRIKAQTTPAPTYKEVEQNLSMEQMRTIESI